MFFRRGQMAEWFKAAVLKTAVGASLPWVRIPLSPPNMQKKPRRTGLFRPLVIFPNSVPYLEPWLCANVMGRFRDALRTKNFGFAHAAFNVPRRWPRLRRML